MTELIDRDAVIWITAETGAFETQRRVRELPKIEAEPVRHGQWVCDHNGIIVCTVCRYPQQIGAKNFCGKCGAKMFGGADDG